MPMYELKCTDCNKIFTKLASMSDKTEHRIPCPDCGSTALETAWQTAPAVLKGQQSACPNSHVCGGGCPHAS